MARKRSGGVNVSEAIRKHLEDNPTTGSTAVAEAVSKQVGKKVSPSYVSNIKSSMKAGKKPGGRRGRKPGQLQHRTRHTGANGSLELTTLEAMKRIVSHVGPDTAKRLIDLLA